MTREAFRELHAIHDRMPVVLSDAAYDAWLDRTMTDSAAALEVLTSAVLDGFLHHAVSTRVNTPKNDDPSCTAAVLAR